MLRLSTISPNETKAVRGCSSLNGAEWVLKVLKDSDMGQNNTSGCACSIKLKSSSQSNVLFQSVLVPEFGLQFKKKEKSIIKLVGLKYSNIRPIKNGVR